MSMRIDAFKQSLRDGGARPNMFEVTGGFPGGGVTTQDMKFLIKAASIPADNIGTITVPYRGRDLKIAGDRTFESWTITVINTNSFDIRKKFEAWQELINGHATNQSAINLDEYFQDWTVKHLDREGKVAETYNMVGAFPTVVSSIDLSHDTKDTIEEFSVTMEYQYWLHQGVNER